MKKIVRFLRPAELEMLDASRYYELQASGLGIDFLDKIDQAVADIGEDPQKWPIIRFQIRRRLIHHFPFGLLPFLIGITIGWRCSYSSCRVLQRSLNAYPSTAHAAATFMEFLNP